MAKLADRAHERMARYLNHIDNRAVRADEDEGAKAEPAAQNKAEPAPENKTAAKRGRPARKG